VTPPTAPAKPKWQAKETLSRRVLQKYKVNSSRLHLEGFLRRAAASVPAGSRVLDAGAGDCVYAPLFQGLQYESADFGKVDKPYGPLTYECDLAAIPFEDARFDMVVLTQVLEHIPDPGRVLTELSRVLKPGGGSGSRSPSTTKSTSSPTTSTGTRSSG
jgi:SAM-dependent methyltransferase